ncbi:hypothetical protein [Leptospira borgpetersenii]|uniref:Uncharacterized protein n=2 Tax=Leptospira borgpetersenii TaxID=174 RepID=Q04PH5_LEPBJ|nr:hypothetical protein [Leptospira borgpetersenii]EMO61669.1 hypothetical protein LEP1GSC133_0532 [Leptospira borgpetersenii serovar Pomona str. 200901868]ABJ77195.1 Hypothetical protein LBJ_2788 [Leptospira borgpetersenii serovar Hardjo-bovis str. JB197]ABJ77895.1 Hypothetical protein LBL_0283 [Leptospira borgpetersenii serovar Hardjo-bovis str. L550]AMX57124.1 hypothetical protein LBK6_01540 [Leptospira borgpetersenii serovar Hardjo]AMX60355.1 hypothetical protein LBK9_01540 [Leptospira bor
MKTICGIFFLLVIYLSFYFSLTTFNLWILLSALSIVHIGFFQIFREYLNLRFYLFVIILHLFVVTCLNLYFRQVG